MGTASTWRLKRRTDLSFRVWPDGCVVYHVPSGDTHYLTGLAGTVFAELIERPASSTQLVRLADGRRAEAERGEKEVLKEVLSELAKRGLVETV
jgi:PqqD family protein of HPr-rel-A system